MNLYLNSNPTANKPILDSAPITSLTCIRGYVLKVSETDFDNSDKYILITALKEILKERNTLSPSWDLETVVYIECVTRRQVEEDGADRADLFAAVQNIYLMLRTSPLVLEF